MHSSSRITHPPPSNSTHINPSVPSIIPCIIHLSSAFIVLLIIPLLSCAFYHHLFCLFIQSDFCELLLPYLVHDILAHGDDHHTQALSQHIGDFFKRCTGNSLQGVKDKGEGTGYQCVRSMLKVIEYLRQQNKPTQGRWEHSHNFLYRFYRWEVKTLTIVQF